MTNDDQEFLSGMMDGEWQSIDVSRSIAEVCGNDALREKWSRYHLVRQALQSEPVLPVGSLAARIASAVADEPGYSNVTAIGEPAPGGASEAFTPLADRESAPESASGLSRRSASGSMAVPGSGPASGSADAAARTHERVVASGGASPSEGRAVAVRTFAAGFGLAASVAVVTAFGLNAWQEGTGADAGRGSATVATVSGSRSDDGVAPSHAAPGTTPGVTLTAATGPATAPAAQSFSGASDPAGYPAIGLAGLAPGARLPTVDLVANTTAAGAYWIAPGSTARRSDSEARLNMYLSQHIENSPTGERQGMLPYSRLVGYDEQAAVGR